MSAEFDCIAFDSVRTNRCLGVLVQLDTVFFSLLPMIETDSKNKVNLATGVKNAMCILFESRVYRMMYDMQRNIYINHSFGKDCPNFQCFVEHI